MDRKIIFEWWRSGKGRALVKELIFFAGKKFSVEKKHFEGLSNKQIAMMFDKISLIDSYVISKNEIQISVNQITYQ